MVVEEEGLTAALVLYFKYIHGCEIGMAKCTLVSVVYLQTLIGGNKGLVGFNIGQVSVG